MTNLREKLTKEIADLKRDHDRAVAAVEQNSRAIEQARGAIWYAESILASLDEDVSESDDPSPPRPDQEE